MARWFCCSSATRFIRVRATMGAGRGDHRGRGGKFAGGAAADAGDIDAEPGGGRIEGIVQGGAAGSAADRAAGCAADSEIRQGQATEVRDAAVESFRESETAAAERGAVWRRRNADRADDFFRDGAGNGGAGGDGIRRAGRGKLRGEVFMVRRSGTAQGQCELAAIDGRSAGAV